MKNIVKILVIIAFVSVTGCKKNKPHKMVDFKIPAADGGSCTLADGKGKVMLLELFSFRCIHCRHQAKDLDKLSQIMDPSKVLFMSVHANGGERMKPMVKAMFHSPKVKLCLDNGSLAAKLQKLPDRFHLKGIPHLMIIKDGQIVKVMRGHHKASKLKSIIKEYL